MAKENLSLQEAADLSGKSVQTIRRAIKSKKLKVRRRKTPQGFNYLVKRDSLCQLYKLPMEEAAPKAEGHAGVPQKRAGEKVEVVAEKVVEAPVEAVAEKKVVEAPVEAVAEKKVEKETMEIQTDDFKSFVTNMQGMMEKHNDERRNFLKLVDTLQERVFVLENQLNLLQAPAGAEGKWYQFWK